MQNTSRDNSLPAPEIRFRSASRPRKFGVSHFSDRSVDELDLSSFASVVNTGFKKLLNPSRHHPKMITSTKIAVRPDRGRASQPGISKEVFDAVSHSRRRR